MSTLSTIIGWAEGADPDAGITIAAFLGQALAWAEGMGEFEDQIAPVRAGLTEGITDYRAAQMRDLAKEYAEYVLTAGYAEEVDDPESMALAAAAQTVVGTGIING